MENKQIEELTKELDYCETHECIGESCAKCRAIWLINNGYRKIPEGSVVLSKEEYEQLSVQYKVWEKLAIEDLLTQERKQAVKEVLEKISNTPIKLSYGLDPYTVNIMMATLVGKRDEIAKEFGVDIGE